jgi:hypothetical protein
LHGQGLYATFSKSGGFWPLKVFRWAGILCGGIALIVAVLYGLAAFFQGDNLQNEIRLPLLSISGVVALLGVSALVAITFSSVNLTDRTQALGLPVGSVRAVIALSLIVLFAILSVYLFSNLSNGDHVLEEDCFTDPERQAFLSSLPVGQFHYSKQMTDLAAQTCAGMPRVAIADKGGPGTPPETPPPPRFSVSYVSTRDPATADFAKQLLVLIGTLVTSVAGFYFGHKPFHKHSRQRLA